MSDYRMETTLKATAITKTIHAVMREIGVAGIAKDRENSFQRYKFRGIDDVLNALSPILVKVGLVILPTVLERECVERQSKKDEALFYVTVEVAYDLIAVEDGSSVRVITVGEAMDSSDKATNKAMSAAYKYMAIQTFAIPTEGDNDADASSHTVAPAKSAVAPFDLVEEAKSAIKQASLATLTTVEARIRASRFSDFEMKELRALYGERRAELNELNRG